ncbi:MAG: ABC transporter ATP-binding protein [Lachnospiraceae bacterium]|nr:ABC transporter ATP-binding protein [Lachnospiraceae bacterium]
MLKLKGVCAGYDGKSVLHNIDLEIMPGTVTVLAGPNGSGKSTLLKTVIGLVRKTSGEIWVEGKNTESLSAAQLAQKVAYLSQNRNVPDISVMRMVLHGRFPYLSYPRRYRETDVQIAKEALCRVGMDAYAEKNINSLSGGMQQKVYIAMALAQDTPVILLDEPTSFLDIAHQLKLMETIRQLADQGKSVVLVLHDISMALQAADVMMILSEGKLVRSGSPEEIFKSGILEQVFGVKIKRVQTDEGWQYYCLAK